jgi:redox-sensitive bicupin YhaK (pirin superfamily)
MIITRKSEDRGKANHGWLDTKFSFSFADYHDPKFMGFRHLRVINEDVVLGGGGFGTHPHRDMEIVTYILSGALQHRDSMGNSAVMKTGDVQRISAGTGIQHSEVNYSPIEPVHLLQIWIMPDHRGAKPGYAERSYGDLKAGQVRQIASKSGENDSVTINQDASIYVAKLSDGQVYDYPLPSTRNAWIQVAGGELEVNGTALKPGDGAAISDENGLKITGKKDAHFLLFDLN